MNATITNPNILAALEGVGGLALFGIIVGLLARISKKD